MTNDSGAAAFIGKRALAGDDRMPKDSSGSAAKRDARLAQALRANLGRRKAQARAKKERDQGDAPVSPEAIGKDDRTGSEPD